MNFIDRVTKKIDDYYVTRSPFSNEDFGVMISRTDFKHWIDFEVDNPLIFVSIGYYTFKGKRIYSTMHLKMGEIKIVI